MAFIEGRPQENFATQLHKALSQLSQYKLQKMMQRQEQARAGAGFKAIGLPEELANISPQAQAAYLKNYLRKPGQESFGKAMDVLQGGEENIQEPRTGMARLQELLAPQGMEDQSQQSVMPQNLMGQQPQQIPEDIIARISQPGATLPGIGEQIQIPQVIYPSDPIKAAAVTNKLASQWKVKPEIPQAPQIDRKKLSEAFRNMTPEMRKDFEKERTLKAKEAKLEQLQIKKDLKPYIDELESKGGSLAEEGDKVLQKMERLVDSGKLTGPMMYNFRKKLESSGKVIGGGLGTAGGAIAGGILGSAIPGVGTLAGVGAGATAGAGLGAAAGEALAPKFVGSKEDQEFIKAGTFFLRNLKGIFGAKPAIQEMDAYMAGIPNLAQTDEGKKAVIHDLRLMGAAWRYQNKVKDDILRETHQVVPANLKDMINERSKSYLQKIKSQFLDDGLKNIEIEF